MKKPSTLKENLIFFWQENQVYLIFVLLVIAVHFTARPAADDIFFAKMLDNMTMTEYLRFRYEQWTSRIIIEFLVVLLAGAPIVWGILNIFIFFVAGYSMIRLLSLDKKKDQYSCALVLGGLFLIPTVAYNGAGWISTTLNYLWPCALALFTLVPVKKLLCKEKVNKWEFVLSIPALVIASNMELVCAVLFSIIFLSIGIYFVQNKKVNPYFILQIFLLLAMLIFIFSCPGNQARSASEVQTWFPEYSELSLFHKLEIGLSSTLYYYIYEPNVLFLCLTLLLFVAVLAKYENAALRIIASIPLFSGVCLGFLSNADISYFPNLADYKYRLSQFGTGLTLTDLSTWMPDLFCLFVCAVMLFTIACLFNKKHAFILIYVLLTGFATRMAMSFSPTIWASDVRTFFLMALTIIFCMGALIKLLAHAQSKHRDVIFLMIGCIEAFSVLNFLFR